MVPRDTRVAGEAWVEGRSEALSDVALHSLAKYACQGAVPKKHDRLLKAAPRMLNHIRASPAAVKGCLVKEEASS